MKKHEVGFIDEDWLVGQMMKKEVWVEQTSIWVDYSGIKINKKKMKDNIKKWRDCFKSQNRK